MTNRLMTTVCPRNIKGHLKGRLKSQVTIAHSLINRRVLMSAHITIQDYKSLPQGRIIKSPSVRRQHAEEVLNDGEGDRGENG